MKANELLSLDAASATITTAAVTIRTLRVGPKQLTQAVFRQLPRRDLVDEETLSVLGTAWGWVNYHPNDGSDVRCTQFVAQFGEDLCRCPFHVRKVSPTRGCWVVESMVERHRDLAALEFLHRALAEDEEIKSHEWSKDGQMRPFWAGRSAVFGYVGIDYGSSWVTSLSNFLSPSAGRHMVKKPGVGWEHVEYTAAQHGEMSRADFIEAFRRDRLPGSSSMPEDLASTLAAMRENEREAVDYARRWNELMDRLGTVPQLFIAV